MNRPSAEISTSNHLDDGRLLALSEADEPTDDEACHLLECAACAALASGQPSPSPLDDLRLLGAAPPPFDLAKAERELLVAAAARSSQRSSLLRFAIPAACVSLAAVALLFVARRGEGDAPRQLPHAPVLTRVTILSSPGARVVSVSAGPDEIVTLEGEATFAVQKLAAGERFRVRVGADEVEVRGTRFTVVSRDGGVSRVAVEEGVVEVRAACCPATTLRAGDSWSAVDEPIAPAASVSADPPPSSRSTSVSATPAPIVPTGSELLAQGTAAYDAGRFAAAAVILARAVATEPSASWARDTSTLAGAARVLSTPASRIPSAGVSVASFDTAAARARKNGDAGVAAAAALGAARLVSGKAASNRFCALMNESALSAEHRREAESRCVR